MSGLPSNVGFGMKRSMSATSPPPHPLFLLQFSLLLPSHIFIPHRFPLCHPAPYSMPIISLQLFHSHKISITSTQLHSNFAPKVGSSRSKIDRCRQCVQPHPAHTKTLLHLDSSQVLYSSHPFFWLYRCNSLAVQTSNTDIFFVSLQSYLNCFPLCIHSVA